MLGSDIDLLAGCSFQVCLKMGTIALSSHKVWFGLPWRCIICALAIQAQKDEAQLWKHLENLQPDEPLPYNMPDLFYSRLALLIKSGQYADRIQPFLQDFNINK